jgi:hypothetical protein
MRTATGPPGHQAAIGADRREDSGDVGDDIRDGMAG